jgi:hypothetical protein
MHARAHRCALAEGHGSYLVVLVLEGQTLAHHINHVDEPGVNGSNLQLRSHTAVGRGEWDLVSGRTVFAWGVQRA